VDHPASAPDKPRPGADDELDSDDRPDSDDELDSDARPDSGDRTSPGAGAPAGQVSPPASPASAPTPAAAAPPGPTPPGDADAPSTGPVHTRHVFRTAVVASLGVVVVAAAVFVAINVRVVLVQIAVAAFIAMSLDPAVRWLIRHRVRRAYAVTIIFLSFLALLGLVVWLAVPPLVEQATKLTTDFPGYLDSLRDRSDSLRAIEDRFNLQAKLDSFAANFVERIASDALAFGQAFIGALFSALLIMILTIYFMADMPRLRRTIVRLFPVRHRPTVSHGVNVVIDKVGAYMIGNLVISGIAGVSTLIVLTALKVPGALPLAFFVALADLIPLIGATLGAVVCTVVALATTELWPNTVLVAVFFVVYQQVENYWIVPRVLRSTVELPSVAVLLAALLGAAVLGLVGALMAIPIAAAIKVLMTPVLDARDAAEVGQPPGG
jgi:predicted PurR-regulated permease PerM